MPNLSVNRTRVSRSAAFFFLFIPFYLSVPLSHADDEPKSQDWYYKQGKAYESSGEYDKAAQAFKAALERSIAEEPASQDPKDLAKWHADQARLFLDQQQLLLAKSHADRALELDPKNKDYRKLQKEAERIFRKEEDRQQQLQSALKEADEAERSGKLSKSLSLWKRGLKLDPQNALAADGIIRVANKMEALHPHIRNARDLSVVSPENPNKPVVAEYLVSSGDVIEVFVWQQPDLTREVLVRPDGKLSFPLVGDIPASGLNLTELDRTITTRLKTYIRFPDVSLAIKRFGGTKTIVLGEVGAPGVYIPTGQGGVLQVIAMAGGFTRDASTSSVMLIRGGLATPEVAKLNLKNALERGRLEENVILQANDIIYVPKGDIASTLDFMQQFYPSISQVLVGQSIATNFGVRETSGGISR